MQSTDYADQRADLLHRIGEDEEEVRVAVQELAGAARSKLDLSERIREFPLSWTIGALIVGLWLGSRGAAVGGRPLDHRDIRLEGGSR